MFAALDVLTGTVSGQCLPRHRHQEFVKFLRATDREVPKDLAIHLGPGQAGLEATVQATDVDELRDLVMTLVHRDGEVRRMLEVRATAASGDDTTAKAEFEAYVRNALEFRGFVDYRESFAVAGGASQVLDELEIHLNGGSAEIVRPALLCALTLLRTITEHADDSSGAIGGECDRAADLYA